MRFAKKNFLMLLSLLFLCLLPPSMINADAAPSHRGQSFFAEVDGQCYVIGYSSEGKFLSMRYDTLKKGEAVNADLPISNGEAYWKILQVNENFVPLHQAMVVKADDPSYTATIDNINLQNFNYDQSNSSIELPFRANVIVNGGFTIAADMFSAHLYTASKSEVECACTFSKVDNLNDYNWKVTLKPKDGLQVDEKYSISLLLRHKDVDTGNDLFAAYTLTDLGSLSGWKV